MFFGRYTFGFRKCWLKSRGERPDGPKRLALFADLDNIGPAYLPYAIRHLETRFDIYCRRGFGANVNGKADYLGRCGVKPVQTYPSIHGRGATDVALAVDAMEEMQRADAFAVLSGDADFATLLQRLRERGKYVVLIGPSLRTSASLRAVCSEFIEIENLSPDTSACNSISHSTNKAVEPPTPRVISHEGHGVDGLIAMLLQTFERMNASLGRPTMRLLEAAHCKANPDFSMKKYKFPKGNPPTLQRASNFTELLRSTNTFNMTRIPGTRGDAADYFLTLK